MLIWADGFEGYGSSSYNAGFRGYLVAQVSYAVSGRTTGYGIGRYGVTNSSITTPSITTSNTLIIGVAWMYRAYDNGGIIGFVGTITEGITIVLSSTLITVNLDGVTIGTYNLSPIPSVWYYIEVKVVCDDTVGSVEIHVNGTSVYTLSNINTANANTFYNKASLTIPENHGAWFDDFYVCDDSGETQNDFLGPLHIVAVFPDADTATKEWTPSTGVTHYNLIDENPYSTSDYISTTTPGATDLFEYPSLVGTGAIIGIQINTTMVITGTGVVIKTPIVSNGVVDEDAGVNMSNTTDLDVRRISITDPNTGSAWTISGLAAAQIGVKAS